MATKKSEPTVNYDSALEIVKLGEQFKQVINDFQAAKINLEDKLRGFEVSELALAKKAAEIEQKEVDVKKRELELKPREVELASKIAHIATVEEAQRRMVEADTKDGKAQEMMKKAQEKLREVEVREEMLHADQLTLSQEKENYKKQVREEIVTNFLK